MSPSGMKKYAVIIEAGPHNFSAYVPDLPGCIAAAGTLEETKQLIAEAIEFHLEGMAEAGEPIPEPSTVTAMVEVQAA